MACRRSGVRIPVAPPAPGTRHHPTPRRTAGGPSLERPSAVTATGSGDRTRLARYEPTAIEPRWQRAGTSSGCTRPTSTTSRARSHYILTMYPYPSGDLHIGHWYIVTPTDALARFHRMHGENVFFPIGFDAFGLPAENAAIKNGINPRDWTMQNIEHERRSSGPWAPCSTGATRSSPASPSSTAGTSGCSCASSRPAWPTAGCRRSTGAPTTGRWPASRSRAPIATAGGAARRSRSATWSSGTCGRPSTPTSCSTSRASTGRSRSGSSRRTGSAGARAARSSSRRRPTITRPAATNCACSPPGPTRCSGRRSWCSPRSTRSSRS